MKNTLYILLLLLCPVLFVQCQKDETAGAGQEVDVTFTARISDVQFSTKAMGDGSKVNSLECAIYGYNKDGILSSMPLIKEEVPLVNGTACFNPILIRSQKYRAVFFAHHKNGAGVSVYNVSDLCNIHYNAQNISSDPETLDAFAYAEDIIVDGGASGYDATLVRPVSQVSVSASQPVADATKWIMTVKTHAMAFDAVTGRAIGSNDRILEFTSDLTAGNKLDVNGTEYELLSYTYLFAQKKGDESPISVKTSIKLLKSDNTEAFYKDILNPVPIEANYRTNIVLQ